MIEWMRSILASMPSRRPKMIQTTKITPRFRFLKLKVEKEQNPEGTGGTGGAAGWNSRSKSSPVPPGTSSEQPQLEFVRKISNAALVSIMMPQP